MHEVILKEKKKKKLSKYVIVLQLKLSFVPAVLKSKTDQISLDCILEN